MQLEMEEMKKGQNASSSKSAYTTPPPKISAPSPAKPKITPPAELKPPLTEGARLNRLRRMCEMKPSGKCNVPEHIHQRWKKSTKEEKEAMCDELDSLGWSKDSFWSNNFR